MSFKIKVFLAYLIDLFQISDLKIKRLNYYYDNKYIRAINYHDVLYSESSNFENQIIFYKKMFSNINYKQFVNFLITGELPENKPGIMLTFDDGYKGNYTVALDILEKYGMTGYFFVSSDLVGTENYMSFEELRDLTSRGHVIGDHTATHHRMNYDDKSELIEYEILYSKKKLEERLKQNIDIFCWCGGEEEHYTKLAADTIKKAGYKYGFMTNSAPILVSNNPFQIQRINVEAGWRIPLVKFQISGIMDKWLKKKRIRVNKLLG